MADLIIPFDFPRVVTPTGLVDPNVVSYPAHAHCNQYAIVTLGVNTAGQIDPAAANDNSNKLLGIIQTDSSAVYAADGTDIQDVFGYTPVGNATQGLGPTAGPQTALVVPFYPPYTVEGNLPTTTGWVSGGTHQANVGTQVGLAIDATSGFYYFDDQAANKCAIIVAKVVGATTQITTAQAETPVGPGGVGDLAARVRVQFIPSTLALLGAL